MENNIHPKVQIGHVHLTVADLDRSVKFYRDMLGFNVTARFGSSAVFLSSGSYHHHIGLNTWAGKNVTPPPEGHSGLYHFAILYPDRYELAKAFKVLWEKKYSLEGASQLKNGLPMKMGIIFLLRTLSIFPTYFLSLICRNKP
jgi:catechol 2,3-dioxygenase